MEKERNQYISLWFRFCFSRPDSCCFSICNSIKYRWTCTRHVELEWKRTVIQGLVSQTGYVMRITEVILHFEQAGSFTFTPTPGMSQIWKSKRTYIQCLHSCHNLECRTVITNQIEDSSKTVPTINVQIASDQNRVCITEIRKVNPQVT